MTQFDKPSTSVVIVGTFIFPFVVLAWAFLVILKNLHTRRYARRFRKVYGRDMTPIESVVLDFEMSKKYKIYNF